MLWVLRQRPQTVHCLVEICPQFVQTLCPCLHLLIDFHLPADGILPTVKTVCGVAGAAKPQDPVR
eukprot:4643624-Alexandrium_andersonii.AAC.1